MTPGQAALRVRIDRRRWLRGARDATLRNPDSCHECTVGSIARAAGIPAERLDNQCRISALDGQTIERRCSCRYLLYSINDDPLLGDAARERMLTAVAARIGIELTFTGRALPPHAVAPTTEGRARQAAISRGDRTDSPARPLQLATSVLTRHGDWRPLDETTLLLDSDPETAWAYAYDLLRSDACEQNAAVQIIM